MRPLSSRMCYINSHTVQTNIGSSVTSFPVVHLYEEDNGLVGPVQAGFGHFLSRIRKRINQLKKDNDAKSVCQCCTLFLLDSNSLHLSQFISVPFSRQYPMDNSPVKPVISDT